MAQNRMLDAYLSGLIKHATRELGVMIEEIGRPTKKELVETALAYHIAGQTKEGLEIVLGKELGEEDKELDAFQKNVATYARYTGKRAGNIECYKAVYEIHFNE